MVNDKPTIPADVDTLQKLEDYVEFNRPVDIVDMAKFWQAVDGRIAQMKAHYTSRAELEELKDGPDDRGYN